MGNLAKLPTQEPWYDHLTHVTASLFPCSIEPQYCPKPTKPTASQARSLHDPAQYETVEDDGRGWVTIGLLEIPHRVDCFPPPDEQDMQVSRQNRGSLICG